MDYISSTAEKKELGKGLPVRTNVLLASALVFAFAISLFIGCGKENTPPSDRPPASRTAIDVEKVVGHPDRYSGHLAVEGTVTQVVDSASVFLLGCADDCVAMPVKYHGQMPNRGATVIADGEIVKSDDGKMVFAAEQVSLK